MNDKEFRSFLNLMMCADPFSCAEGWATLKSLLNRESVNRGYYDWIEAYHRFRIKEVSDK